MQQIEFESPSLNPQGEIIAWAHHTAQQMIFDLGNGIALELLLIPGGMFQMGSLSHYGYLDERPQHLVMVKAFLLGKAPITQEQWQAVMGKLPPCRFKGAKRPVERVSWDEAQKFCSKLSQRTGQRFRLPAESEWEYACRAGSGAPFTFGETLSTDLSNYCGEHVYREGPRGLYRHETTPVDAFPRNAFGLYDMHGNLWEWCADRWHDDYESAPRDGSVWEAGTSPERVVRGGSWHEPPENCRSATRLKFLHSEADDLAGLRVAAGLS